MVRWIMVTKHELAFTDTRLLYVLKDTHTPTLSHTPTLILKQHKTQPYTHAFIYTNNPYLKYTSACI